MEEEQQPIAPQEQEDVGRPSWLPDKFKDEHAFLDAYRNLEREHTQTRQQVNELESAIENILEATPPPEQQYQPTDPLDFLQQYEEALINGDAKTLIAINMGLMEQSVQRAMAPVMEQLSDRSTTTEDLMFAKLVEEASRKAVGEDFDDIRYDIKEVLERNPHLLPDTDNPDEVAETIGIVAKAVRQEKGQAAGGDNLDDSGRQAKLQAQTLFGRGQGASPEAAELRELIRDRLKEVNTYGYGR